MRSERRFTLPAGGRGAAGKILFAAVLCAIVPTLDAGGTITREEALKAAFPGATIQSERLFLTAGQMAEAAALAGVEIPNAMMARYRAEKAGTVLGFAYVDTHLVRSKPESLLVILDADGTLRRIEVTAFLEPPEYRAPPGWYGQYEGKKLNPDLSLQRAIRPIAGATLTAAAANRAVRRVLAIHRAVERSLGKAAP